MICICCHARFTYPAPCPTCGFRAADSAEPGDYPAQTRIADRYVVSASLGTGRFGTCCAAHDERFGGDVAVKFIHPGYLPNPAFVEQFVSGMRFLQQNNYPTTTQVVDVGAHEGRAYVATELLAGVSLREHLDQRIRDKQPFSLPEIDNLVRRIAAHLVESDAGIHGALCPENIRLLPDGMKVMDAGLVENLPLPVLEVRLLANAASSPYVAPELRNGTDFSAASDVFSLGVLIAEMACAHPFSGHVESFISQFQLTHSPLESLLRRALSDAPQSRFRDAEALARLLAVAAGNEPPHFNRPWGAAAPASLAPEPPSTTGEYSDDTTQQVRMDEIISQHQRSKSEQRRPAPPKPTSVPAPPKPTSVPALPKPASVPAPPKPASVPAPPKPASVPAPSRTQRKTLNPVIPPPPKRPEPAVRRAILPPLTDGPQKAVLDGAAAGVLQLPDDELRDMLPIDELSGLIEISDAPQPTTTENAAAQLEQRASTALDTSTGELLKRARDLDGIDPRFIRAAHKLETERISQEAQQSAALIRDNAKNLDGINPRFIRAAAKLEQARIADVATTPSKAPSPEASESADDWRDRIASETSASPDSVISFLAPPTQRAQNHVEGFPRTHQRQGRNRPPAPPPPLPPKRR
ncbi:MAG: protein kinase [Myxococcales bacterium]|nr:protein kinase [Myxococcales bacterium]